ncbi:MAG: hypothetical protein ACT4OG_09620 [Alphaproteobacteria bacterium]
MWELPIELKIMIAGLFSAGVLSLFVSRRRIQKGDPEKLIDAYAMQAEGIAFLISTPIAILYPYSLWAWGVILALLMAFWTIGAFRGSRIAKSKKGS